MDCEIYFLIKIFDINNPAKLPSFDKYVFSL